MTKFEREGGTIPEYIYLRSIHTVPTSSKIVKPLKKCHASNSLATTQKIKVARDYSQMMMTDVSFAGCIFVPSHGSASRYILAVEFSAFVTKFLLGAADDLTRLVGVGFEAEC